MRRALLRLSLRVAIAVVGTSVAVGTSAAVGAQSAPDRTARVERAEVALRRGDRAAAERVAAALVADYERRSGTWTARDHVAAGRAYLIVSAGNANAVRSALRAFDAGASADSSLDETVLRASDLLLEKFVAPDAAKGYEAVLRRNPKSARALLGVARVMEFTGKGDALGKAREAIAADAGLAPAHLFVATLHLEAERNDSAQAAARRALAIDPEALDAWAVIGAVAWIAGDSAGFRAARSSAEGVTPKPAAFYVTLSEAAARQRRYADAERFAVRALELDSLSVPALGALGTNRLRTGDIAAGRAQIERAFAIDPFNLWHKNTLDLLDVLAGFRTVRMGRFERSEERRVGKECA